MQITLDVVSVAAAPFIGRFPSAAPNLRYAMSAVDLCLAAWGVVQAVRVPPLKNVEMAIRGLPPVFEG